MAKYDVDRFENPPDEDLICCICQCVLDNPLESPCRHVFCKVCIETWLTNRSNCPNCRKRLRISKLKPVLPIVRNMINRLLIICENREHGCTGGIKLEMYDRHVQNCDFAPIKCLNTGCGQTVLRKNMLAHEQTCKYRLIMCKKGCGLPISMEKLKKHNCLDELKKSMTAMEEQYKQRLLELEAKLNTKIQVLEDRIKAMEENCQQDYGSGWGSARDSYSSMAGFDESDSPSRDMEYTDIQDFEENNDDDSNSYYYSGNEDNDFESTPEYQEAQTYEVYSPDEPHVEEEQQEHDEEEEDEVGEEEEDSDTAFFLNSDMDSNNDSEGDLNDSLLDSSDSDSIADDQEPVQVYEVSPTSPHSDHNLHQEDSSLIENVSYEEVSDPVSVNSPHSSTHRDRGRRDQHRQPQDGDRDQQTGFHEEQSLTHDEAPAEGFYPRDNNYDNEHSSLCSLRVEYGSSGRASPRENEHGYASEPVEESEANLSSNEPIIIHVDPQSGDGRRHPDEASRRRRRSRETSRAHRRSSRNKRSRHSSNRDRTGQPSQASDAASEHDAPLPGGRQEETAASRDGREFFYGVPVDESDSSADPPWERKSEDVSSDVSISDESLLMYDSFDDDDDDDDFRSSSPEVYEKFISSLHNVDSSESDKTWVPDDPASDIDGVEDNTADPADRHSEDADQLNSETPDRSGSQEDPREVDQSRRSSRTRLSRRTRSRPGDRPASDRDPASRSSDSETVNPTRKRPVTEDSSSESENTEDSKQHPAWKRRR
ncbi:dentin sialophosphoprotein-like [Lytechinus pictus]|uniref:dentin sialophosphoprotein-like n=1 Tax=Lytechinus pictus TaxID=7653 RepID=UPI0030BA036C